MRLLTIFVIWLVISLSQIVDGQNYSVFTLNKDLISNANAVIREQSYIATVTDTGKVSYTEHLVITVLNKNGDGFATFMDTYDKFEKITDLKGKIYDQTGKVIRKIKASDFLDRSNISDFSLYEDNRVKYFVPMVNTYPYTVEYENSGIISGTIDYHTWRPQNSYDLAVEHSIYKVIVPKHFNVKFKKVNYDKEPQISESNDNTSFTFEVNNLYPIDEESFSPGLRDLVPVVYAIPEYFKIEGYSGSNKNWKSFGEWDKKLNVQENKLSAKTKSDLAEIQAKAVDRTDLIKKVYEYMQSKTRYVSIQLGIGGWKPFDASIVDKYGYGDCKALSNYMKTLLKEVGVESVYTLALAGRSMNDIYTDETFNQFNHAILCVPGTPDTIWLECTSQLIPFGFIGDFTDNRHVLLINENGGKIVKTPKYVKEQNLLNRNAEVIITPDGNAECHIKTKYTGLQYDDHARLLYSPRDKQKEQLYKSVDIPSFTIEDFKINEKKERLPSFDLDLNLTADKWASVMGNRLLLPLNLMNREDAISNVMKERKTHLRLRYGYIDSDTITYHLPKGYLLEFMPPPFELKSEFGTYSTKVISAQDKTSFVYVRKMAMNDGYYPSEKFKDFVAFIKEVSKQDNVKVSLQKTP